MKAANYQTAFPQGPITSTGLMISMEWQRAFLTVWNRTGGAPGIDMTYQVSQITQALKAAQAAESDAQSAIRSAASAQNAAAKAQASADAAEQNAQTGIATATTAQKSAGAAQTSADAAEKDARTGIANAAAAQARADISVNGQYGVAGSPTQYGLGLVMGTDGSPYFWYNQTNPAQIALVTPESSPSFAALTIRQALQLTPVPSSQIRQTPNPKPGMVMMSSDNGNLYYRGQDGNWHQIATSGTL